MTIQYKVNAAISAEQFRSLLQRSGLAERRPVDNTVCLQGMLDNSNLLITAWHGETLVGVARSMTDFHYACYLSDLAVAAELQKEGIGKALLQLTRKQLQQTCKIILVAAPQANSYYQRLGFENNPRCWIAESDRQ